MQQEEKTIGSKLITTSVVRGSEQGESHGGVYLIDLENQKTRQVIDWNTADIDWQGRGLAGAWLGPWSAWYRHCW